MSDFKIGDHVKIKENHVTKPRNLAGRYGHITDINSETAEVQFNDFKAWIALCDLIHAR